MTLGARMTITAGRRGMEKTFLEPVKSLSEIPTCSSELVIHLKPPNTLEIHEKSLL